MPSRCGHLTEVGHQGRPVADAQGTRVHGLPAGAGREGEVGGNPGDGGDETRNALDFHAESSMLCVDQDWLVIYRGKYQSTSIKIVALAASISPVSPQEPSNLQRSPPENWPGT